MSRIDYTKMAARVAKAAGGTVFASLHDYKAVATATVNGTETPTLYKVLVSFSTNKADRQALRKAVASVFDHHVAPVEASFRAIPGHTNAYVGFVARNTEVRPYETETASQMKVMAGNLLMDETDQSLWTVQANGDSKYLTRHAEDNLDELVALASMCAENRRVGMPVLAHLATPAFPSGELVAYVNPTTLEMAEGFVLAEMDDTLQVLDRDSLERVAIDPELVVESAFIELSETFSEVAAPAATSLPSMEDYYKQIFGYDASFWNEFKKILDQRATV